MLSFLIGKKVESDELGIGIITNAKKDKVDMDFPIRPFNDVLVDEQFWKNINSIQETYLRMNTV